MAETTLVIAIDETGTFRQQKLAGVERGRSGIVAVLTTWDRARLVTYLQQIGTDLGLRYPGQFHVMEILNQDRRKAMGLALSNHAARELVARLRAKITSTLDERVGVVGPIPGRYYFHEQEAYGEMLLATLALVQRRCRRKLAAVQRIEVVIATRSARELTGFYRGGPNAERYHSELVRFVKRFLDQSGWPAKTVVRTDFANQNPYLILADSQAGLVRDEPDWVATGDAISLPASLRAAAAIFRRVDEASTVLLDLADGKIPHLASSANQQRGFEILRRLTTVAHAHVADRFGTGSLVLAERIIDFTWPHAKAMEAEPILGELCTIAAEIHSHRGYSGDDPRVAEWTSRTSTLPSRAWAADSLTARAVRFDHRCQTVQTDHFNAFEFDDAYLEFCDLKIQYEELVGGPDRIDPFDETYGKILGTLGQACGFLRARDPELADECLPYLERSAGCFEKAQPLFRAMSLGFRLTELWDAGDLDRCQQLIDEQVPPTDQADPYSLLHLLRLAAARRASGTDVAAVPLVRRLLELSSPPETAGATPWDLCLKWALYLAPESKELKSRANAWCDELASSSPALLATSLPLFALLERTEQLEGNLERLKQYPGFVEHWKTKRAATLIDALSTGRSLDYACLRAMPWNYA